MGTEELNGLGMKRRHFLTAMAASSSLGLSLFGKKASAAVFNDLKYGPLRNDPAGKLMLPEGFSYHLFSEAGEVMDDGFLVPGAQDGMAAFAGPGGKTYLVRNHELRPGDQRPTPF